MPDQRYMLSDFHIGTIAPHPVACLCIRSIGLAGLEILVIMVGSKNGIGIPSRLMGPDTLQSQTFRIAVPTTDIAIQFLVCLAVLSADSKIPDGIFFPELLIHTQRNTINILVVTTSAITLEMTGLAEGIGPAIQGDTAYARLIGTGT